MSTYILLLNDTDQGIRTIKHSLALGNVRSTTLKAFTEAEYRRIAGAL